MAKKIKVKNQKKNKEVSASTENTETQKVVVNVVNTPTQRPRAPRNDIPKDAFDQKQQTHSNIESGPKVFDYLKGREFPYKEKTLKEYQASLANMSKNQLHEEMMKANLIPNITDRPEIIARLEKAYLEKQASFLLRYSKSATPNTNGVDGERAQRIINILNR